VNTLAETDTSDAATASLPKRAINQQAAAMALLTLISPGLDVPAATVDVRPSWSEVTIHVHRDPAGLEWWREALGLNPDAGDLSLRNDYCIVRFTGQIGSIEVCLIGFLPLPIETAASGSDAA
jgi:hypothetical protein